MKAFLEAIQNDPMLAVLVFIVGITVSVGFMFLLVSIAMRVAP